MPKTKRAVNASCVATTKAGDPCPAPAMADGSGFCMFHHPSDEVRIRALVAQKAGMSVARMKGKHFKPGVALETPRDWLNVIAMLTNDLASQPNTPPRVSSFALLSKEAREWWQLAEAVEGRMIDGEVL